MCRASPFSVTFLLQTLLSALSLSCPPPPSPSPSQQPSSSANNACSASPPLLPNSDLTLPVLLLMRCRPVALGPAPPPAAPPRKPRGVEASDREEGPCAKLVAVILLVEPGELEFGRNLSLSPSAALPPAPPPLWPPPEAPKDEPPEDSARDKEAAAAAGAALLVAVESTPPPLCCQEARWIRPKVPCPITACREYSP